MHTADDAQSPAAYARHLNRLWSLDLVVFERGGHDVDRQVLQGEVSEAIAQFWRPGPAPDDSMRPDTIRV